MTYPGDSAHLTALERAKGCFDYAIEQDEDSVAGDCAAKYEDSAYSRLRRSSSATDVSMGSEQRKADNRLPMAHVPNGGESQAYSPEMVTLPTPLSEVDATERELED